MLHPKPSHYSYHEAIELIGKRLHPLDWTGIEREIGGYGLSDPRPSSVVINDQLIPRNQLPVRDSKEYQEADVRWLFAREYFWDLVNHGHIPAWIKQTDGSKRVIPEGAFDELKETRTKNRLGKSSDDSVVDTEVNAEELEELVDRFKSIYAEHSNETFPQDPFEQLRGAIDAVFDSWTSDKAITYRQVEHITGLNGDRKSVV